MTITMYFKGKINMVLVGFFFLMSKIINKQDNIVFVFLPIQIRENINKNSSKMVNNTQILDAK